MPFEAYTVALELLRSLVPILARVRTRSSSLAKQLEEAASSTPLNLREGRRRQGRDRLHLYNVAAGSADEIGGCLEVAEALGYLQRRDIEASLALADRVLAMSWKLTH